MGVYLILEAHKMLFTDPTLVAKMLHVKTVNNFDHIPLSSVDQ